MNGARATNSIGTEYTRIPTTDNPVWLIVHNYTQKDINKSANGDDFLHCKFDVNGVTEPAALLKYTFEYHPRRYFWLFHNSDADEINKGSMSGRNPNGLDLIRGLYTQYNTLTRVKTEFRDWWIGLKEGVAETSEAHPDGRAELMRQMSREGIINCINNYDVPAAIEIVKNTKNINHVNWQIYRDQLIPLLENSIRNNYHLMDDEQKKKFTPYVPPADYEPTNSGTSSGTMHGTFIEV